MLGRAGGPQMMVKEKALLHLTVSDTRRSPKGGIHALSPTAAYTDKLDKTSMDENTGHEPDAPM